MKSHDTEIRVRYEDADPMGFLHHAQYFSFFEVGRLDFFRARGGDYRAMEETGLFVVVAKAECRYRRPARFDDLLTVRTTIDKITPAKIVQRYEMLRGDELLAEGEVTLALMNREGQVQRVPDWFREIY
jgi:acyl-CoA thioester hydrolase